MDEPTKELDIFLKKYNNNEVTKKEYNKKKKEYNAKNKNISLDIYDSSYIVLFIGNYFENCKFNEFNIELIKEFDNDFYLIWNELNNEYDKKKYENYNNIQYLINIKIDNEILHEKQLEIFLKLLYSIQEDYDKFYVQKVYFNDNKVEIIYKNDISDELFYNKIDYFNNISIKKIKPFDKFIKDNLPNNKRTLLNEEKKEKYKEKREKIKNTMYCKNPECNKQNKSYYDGFCIDCYDNEEFEKKLEEYINLNDDNSDCSSESFDFDIYSLKNIKKCFDFENITSKEKFIKKFIEKKFELNIKWISNKQIPYCDLRYIPDLFTELKDRTIIVEIDEHKHSKYNFHYENERVLNINKYYESPVIFIRFNPDSYIENGKYKKSLFTKIEMKKYKIFDMEDFDNRINTLLSTIEYWIETKNIEKLNYIKLFY